MIRLRLIGRLIGEHFTIEHYHPEQPDTSELAKLFNLKNVFELRVFNTLKRNQIYTVETLQYALETNEIKECRNLGEKSIAFLREAIVKVKTS